MMYYLFFLSLFIRDPKSNDEYICKHLFKAKVLEIFTGIPASVQIAQAIVESGGGKSYIAVNSNNHFGIKYYSNYKGSYFTDRNNVKWRKYTNTWHSYIDHALFMMKHYPQLRYNPVTNCNQLKGYSKKAKYWQYIHNYIKRKKIDKYDLHWN